MASGCRDTMRPPDPDPSGETVVTTVAEGQAVWMIDPSAGRILARLDVGGQIEGAATSPDGAMLYVGVRAPGFRNELVAVDTRAGSVRWRLPLAENGRPHVIDGVGLRNGEVIAVSPDGERLHLWRAEKEGVVGVVSLDLRTRRPVGFSGPWNVAAGGLVPLAPEGVAPRGALAVLASRENASGGPRGRAAVYLLDPVSLAPLDSILPASLGGPQDQDIWQIIPAPGGRDLFLAGSHQLVRYDLVARRVAASTPRPSSGALSVTSDTGHVVISDSGTWPDNPGSGHLFLFGPNLEPRGVIDVSTALGGRPSSPTATRTGLMAASRDGRTVYVRAGSDLVGPLYPAQPARLLVVDVVSRTLRRAVKLDGYGLGAVFIRAPGSR